MIDQFRSIEFATPLVLMLIPLLAVLFLPRLVAGGQSAALLVADMGLLRSATRSTWRIRLRWVPAALRIAAIALLIVAIARPREGVAEALVPEEGIDIVISADISTSMTQRMPGGRTRIAALRDVLREFVDEMEMARLGLVAFQSRAIPLSPLTHDQDAILERVDQLVPGLVPDGTAIGLGIAEALDLLEGSPALSRVVVLLTDGQNNTGEIQPMTAARMAEALGIRVYTIGFHSGSTAFQEVDREGLTRLAELTGAGYYDATSEEELSQAYSEIAQLESSRLVDRRFLSYREFGPWVAAVAAGLLIVDGLIRVTWFRRQP
jgi:Ca-activated chloride channel homolog